MEAKHIPVQQDRTASDSSTVASAEEVCSVSVSTGALCQEAGQQVVQGLPINLSLSLGIWSAGSARHEIGRCKPCAFQWKDGKGCENGLDCEFCHLCLPGEIKQRKKEKLAYRKMARAFRKQGGAASRMHASF
jgi:hypothetical protein